MKKEDLSSKKGKYFWRMFYEKSGKSTTSQTLTSGSVLLPMFNVVAYSKDLDSETEK